MNHILQQIFVVKNITLVDDHREWDTFFEQLDDQIFPQGTKNIQSIDDKQVMSVVLIRFVSIEYFFKDKLSIEIESTFIDFLIVLLWQMIVVLEAVTPVT